MESRARVVVIGGGFAGLEAARSLSRQRLDVTLVDRRNFHLFQPLLYQVATGGLSPADIASPLRWLLRRYRRTTVLLDEAIDFRLDSRRVVLRSRELGYDYLVVATGARTQYFGNDWSAAAPGLKDLADAREIRRRLLSAFEIAERDSDDTGLAQRLTFVVIGGGPTGVELAGAIAELARETLPRDFRRIDTRDARVLLVEGGARLLPSLPEELSQRAATALARLGVEVWTGAKVTSVDTERVEVDRGGERTEVPARTALWAAGVGASPLGRVLAERAGAEIDRSGRVVVASDCSLPTHPEVFVIGDLARYAGANGILPGVAPVAMQEGRYVARVISRRLRGLASEPFRYRDKGDLATIGRSAAVARVGKLRFSGFAAWIVWLFVHILYLVGFQNRLLVLFQWAWSYVTWNRRARLIADDVRESRTTEP